jgi:hypothetical protein
MFLAGYASALMKLGITYGTSDALSFTEDLFHDLFVCSVEASVDLARIKGAYPKYKTCVFDSQIIRNHFTESDIEIFKSIGIRNCSLVSIAPTGSISTMFGETGGCEPEFAIKYTRKTESLDNGKEKYFDVFCKTAQEYIDTTGNKELPSYFIESAINHYTLTDGKDKRLYNAAKKLADCWVANIGPGKKEWYDGHQEMEQALVRFGRFVNDMEGQGKGNNYINNVCRQGRPTQPCSGTFKQTT